MLFSHWSIRRKLRIGLGLLAISVLTLFGSAYYGLYAYRGIVKSISSRSAELPLADKLRDHIAELHEILNQQSLDDGFGAVGSLAETNAGIQVRQKCPVVLDDFCRALRDYRDQLDANRWRVETSIDDDRKERKILADIDKIVAGMKKYGSGDKPDWILENPKAISQLRENVETLRKLSGKLPTYLHERFRELASDVRTEYRFAIFLAWTTTVLASILLFASVLLFRKWIARPLAKLVRGSRQVAAGNFDHRIKLDSDDEMRELADAMNDMTARFRQIRDDLDAQVRERTQQVVRSEQLASVGFLAAGVAHEINNPLASIAMCSESLESRLTDLLRYVGKEHEGERDIVRNYLEMIQKEAFRCKQITEKLLDFSRRGDPERHNADLRELVAGVIEMIRHLGKYHDKRVVLRDGEPVIAEICAQEMKQVVLNLITNGLDSVDSGGTVTINVLSHNGEAKIVVEDNGCGMTPDVLKHLFEPFFTRRRGGQGTGLGLSITYRIIEEHQGQIVPHSDGPGKGSRFTVSLPLGNSAHRNRRNHRPKAAA